MSLVLFVLVTPRDVDRAVPAKTDLFPPIVSQSTAGAELGGRALLTFLSGMSRSFLQGPLKLWALRM